MFGWCVPASGHQGILPVGTKRECQTGNNVGPKAMVASTHPPKWQPGYAHSSSLPPRAQRVRGRAARGGQRPKHPLSNPQTPVGTFCRKVPRPAIKHRAAAHRQHTTRRHSPPPGPISGTARQAVPTSCTANLSPSPRAATKERSAGEGRTWVAKPGHQRTIPQTPVGTFCRKVPRPAIKHRAAAHGQNAARRHSPPPGPISGTARQAVPTSCTATLRSLPPRTRHSKPSPRTQKKNMS